MEIVVLSCLLLYVNRIFWYAHHTKQQYIRSITKTEGKLEELLEELRVLRVYVFPCTSTITALSETNFNPNKLNKINIDGFKFVFSNEFKKKKKSIPVQSSSI